MTEILPNPARTSDGPSAERSNADRWVPRFRPTERVAHWWTVVMVATALVTGLAMGEEAESGPMLNVHVASVVLIGVGIVVALVFGNTRAMLRSMRALFVFDRLDIAWSLGRFRHPFRRESHPAWGKFNTGQKVMAWLVSVSMSLVIITGIQSWRSGGDMAATHMAAAMATLALLGAHVFMALVNPSTRPALPGMVLGRVRRSWAATHHRGWLDDVERDASSARRQR
jgi:formate dehydrogenase gamma subunit